MTPLKLDKHGIANLRLCLVAGNEVNLRPNGFQHTWVRIDAVKKTASGLSVRIARLDRLDTRRSYFAKRDWQVLQPLDLLRTNGTFGQSWIMPGKLLNQPI